jgi:hypothetical protein
MTIGRSASPAATSCAHPGMLLVGNDHALGEIGGEGCDHHGRNFTRETI